jgi:hypothetical protein
MLAFPESAANFSAGCACRESATLFLRPSPTLAFANDYMPVSPPGILAAASLFIHYSNILCLAISCEGGNRPFSAGIGTGLCRFLDMNFRELSSSRISRYVCI